MKFHTFKDLFISMRPKQWVKNLFVFAPLLFVRAFDEQDMVRLAFFAFVLFSFASSSVYLLNDCLDREKDRLHPKKRNRPIASGALSVSVAAGAALICAALALGGAFFLGYSFGLVIVGYLVLNILYSFVLKHVVILDIFSVALGFVLRVVGGALAIAVPVSVWILLCTFFLTLFLAVNKRRSELMLGGETRTVLQSYSPEFLEQMSTITLSITLITYAFYTFSSEHSRLLMLTVPVVVYGLLYYVYAVGNRGKGDGDPTDIVLSERPLQCAIALYVLLAFGILFFAG